MCRLSRNSGSLNLLEPWGLLQACNGKPLPYSLVAINFILNYLNTPEIYSEYATVLGIVSVWRYYSQNGETNPRLQNCEKLLLFSLCLSVHPPAWNNSAPSWRIFVSFDIWGFYWNLSRRLKFELKGTSHKDVCKLIIISHRIILVMRIFQTKVVEKFIIHVSIHNFANVILHLKSFEEDNISYKQFCIWMETLTELSQLRFYHTH